MQQAKLRSLRPIVKFKIWYSRYGVRDFLRLINVRDLFDLLMLEVCLACAQKKLARAWINLNTFDPIDIPIVVFCLRSAVYVSIQYLEKFNRLA
jgi:hypothetical protein